MRKNPGCCYCCRYSAVSGGRELRCERINCNDPCMSSMCRNCERTLKESIIFVTLRTTVFTSSMRHVSLSTRILPKQLLSSGVARICCQEGHKSYWVFAQADCRHIVDVRLCTLKKINSCKSRGARAPVPHSWRRQCFHPMRRCMDRSATHLSLF